MTPEEARSRIKARVWQAVAQAELDLANVSRETLDELVEITTDAALLEIDEEIGKELIADRKESAPAGTNDEEILWEGRPFLSVITRYVITNQRVRIIEGMLGKSREDIELVRIQDVDQKQSLTERLLNLGDIIIHSHDPSHPKVLLNNVKDPETVHEILRRAVIDAREKYRLSYREEM